MTGGEIVVMAIIDSVSRLLSGVLNEESLINESFNEYLLEAPQYTRPVDFNGDLVPDVLISGHHRNIAEWKKQQAIAITKKKRPDLYKKYLKQQRKENVD
jgi:tRNA (guanine37-N1)-methyltransferase